MASNRNSKHISNPFGSSPKKKQANTYQISYTLSEVLLVIFKSISWKHNNSFIVVAKQNIVFRNTDIVLIITIKRTSHIIGNSYIEELNCKHLVYAINIFKAFIMNSLYPHTMHPIKKLQVIIVNIFSILSTLLSIVRIVSLSTTFYTFTRRIPY